MTTMTPDQSVTVYCPECRAPMHLPNRLLLGRKARCWHCEKKVILREPPAAHSKLAQETLEEPHIDTDMELEGVDSQDIPENFWEDSDEQIPPKIPSEVQPHADQSVSLPPQSIQRSVPTMADLEQASRSTKSNAHSSRKTKTRESSSRRKSGDPNIIRCDFCETRIPVVGRLLETDGCPCCGSRPGSTTYQVLQSQPDWVQAKPDLVLEEVIQGPFGTIYQGQQAGKEGPISVRPIPNDCWLPKDQQKLLAGLWKTRTFSHPFAAGLTEIFIHEGQVHLLGPALSGVSLAEELARQAYSPMRIARTAWALADVLDGAHSAGLLHRDLKPSNILIHQNASPKVLGFGLPRRKTGGGYLKGPKGLVIGTVAYLAPEQALGDGPLDQRSDIYSFGILLYQMLTGQLPYRGTLNQVLAQIAEKPLPVPSSIRPDISWEWDLVCRHCTAKAPKDRYQSAAELREALFTIAQTFDSSSESSVSH